MILIMNIGENRIIKEMKVFIVYILHKRERIFMQML